MTVLMTATPSVRISACSVKVKWDKPISKTFYARLREKAMAMAQSVARGPSFVDYVMEFIDDYLANREIPHWTVHKAILGYFHALKDDIDKAIARCQRARQRAAERAARRKPEPEMEAEKQAEMEMVADTVLSGNVEAGSSTETSETSGCFRFFIRKIARLSHSFLYSCLPSRHSMHIPKILFSRNIRGNWEFKAVNLTEND